MAARFGSILGFIKRKDILLAGYWREITESDDNPHDIIRMCIDFCNEVTVWKLSDDELTKFHQQQNDEEITGPSFVLADNYHFKMELIPKNTQCHKRDGIFTTAAVKLDTVSVPKEVSGIVLFYVLTLKELGIEYRKSYTIHMYGSGSCYWYTYQMKYDNTKELTQLTFSCFAELLTITYYDGKIEYFGDYKMDIHHEYKWKLDQDEISKFKSAKIDDALQSKTFNHDTCCIWTGPNGATTTPKPSKGIIVTLLKFFRLPNKIDAIKYKAVMKLEAIVNGKKLEWIKIKEDRFSYENRGGSWIDDTIQFEGLKDADTICYSVVMDIVSVYNDDGEEIERNVWNEYGFL